VKEPSSHQEVVNLANQGNAKAQYELGLMHELGLGIEKNLNQAFVWYQKSADQNYAKAQYNLGIFYALAKSVDKDIEQSKHWIRKANENGYSGGSVF